MNCYFRSKNLTLLTYRVNYTFTLPFKSEIYTRVLLNIIVFMRYIVSMLFTDGVVCYRLLYPYRTFEHLCGELLSFLSK